MCVHFTIWIIYDTPEIARKNFQEFQGYSGFLIATEYYEARLFARNLIKTSKYSSIVVNC